MRYVRKPKTRSRRVLCGGSCRLSPEERSAASAPLALLRQRVTEAIPGAIVLPYAGMLVLDVPDLGLAMLRLWGLESGRVRDGLPAEALALVERAAREWLQDGEGR